MAVEFGTPMLIRAEIVRIIGAHKDDEYVFTQKKLDKRRYPSYKLATDDGWPGVAVPEGWAETPPAWDIEPLPNGCALVRCRRIELQTPLLGLYVGEIRIAEGTLRETEEEDRRPWRTRELDDRRWLDLYEIATPPTRQGRGRIALVHHLDASVVPLRMTPA